MIYRVVFTPTVRADALGAFRWLAERSPTAAARWYAGLEKAIAKLSKFPESHPVAEEESEQIGIPSGKCSMENARGFTASYSRSRRKPFIYTIFATLLVAPLNHKLFLTYCIP